VYWWRTKEALSRARNSVRLVGLYFKVTALRSEYPGEVRVTSTGALSSRGHVLRPAVTSLRECGSRAITDNSATPHTRKRLNCPAAYINI